MFFPIFLFTTQDRQKKLFEPRVAWIVRMYTCGPTVYGRAHLGNLRAFFVARLWRDILEQLGGYRVQHTMNITDVWHLTSDGDDGDDKMIVWAQKENLTAWQVAKKYEELFLQDIALLWLRFDHHPRATDYIKEQIEIIKTLIKKSYTYEIEGDGIYMDTSLVPDYGKLLPKAHLQWIIQWARIYNDAKKNPSDFALRKFSPRDQKRDMERLFDGDRAGKLIDSQMELSLEEERTRGFPWWHIECSAMARATLGEYLDIHTWWIDHIPVHHTNEICQSECSFCEDKPWVKYRLHSQFLNILGQKISKSLNNTLNLDDCIQQWFQPEDLRMFFLQAHYRSFQDFDWEKLSSSAKARQKIKRAVQPYVDSYNGMIVRDEFFEYCAQALCDDADTPQFLAHLFSNLKQCTQQKAHIILWFDQHLLRLGLFDKEKKSDLTLIPWYHQAMELLRDRTVAKKQKNYQKADLIKQSIIDLGFGIKDNADGTTDLFVQ